MYLSKFHFFLLFFYLKMLHINISLLYGENLHIRVINVPIITTVSTLCDNEIERLKQLMEEIDGVIITDSDWRRASTYLTVGNAILTLKVFSLRKFFNLGNSFPNRMCITNLDI